MGKETRQNFSQSIRDMIYGERQKGRCNYCLKELPQQDGHFDHIFPERFFNQPEGLNDRKNCQFLCYLCHKKKTVLEKEYQRTDRDIRKAFCLRPDPLERLSENEDTLFTDHRRYFDSILLNLDWVKKTQPKKMDVTQVTEDPVTEVVEEPVPRKVGGSPSVRDSSETKTNNLIWIGLVIAVPNYLIINSRLENQLLSLILSVIIAIGIVLVIFFMFKKLRNR